MQFSSILHSNYCQASYTVTIVALNLNPKIFPFWTACMQCAGDFAAAQADNLSGGGRTAPLKDATSADTKDAEDNYTPVHASSSRPLSSPPSPPPALKSCLIASDVAVKAGLAQPAVASSSASSSPVAPGPALADSAGAISDQASQVRLAEDIPRASSNSPVAPLSCQSSMDSASVPAGNAEDDLDQAAADQIHAQAHDLSAGGVSNAADALSASQTSSSADGGNEANSEEDVPPEVQPAAEQSAAAAGADLLSPENAVDAVVVMPGTVDAFHAWKKKTGRVWPALPGCSGFGFLMAIPQVAAQHPGPAAVHPEPADVDPQPADVDPQPAAIGPQPATVGPQPAVEVGRAREATKEGLQGNVQAATWVPGQAHEEVQQQPQQQQAGSGRTDSGVLPGASVSEEAATKQQLQQQLCHLNGQAAPFVPNLKAAKRLQQEEGGMKAGVGLFGKQGAGLLQQQQADSPKIAAVKVNVLSMICNMFWLLTVMYMYIMYIDSLLCKIKLYSCIMCA